MPMYLYRTDGRPAGFRFNQSIHDLDGAPLARVFGTHVHRFDGSYIGELFKEMIVDKPVPSARSLPPIAPPPPARSPGMTCPRRGIVDYGFADLFPLLFSERGGEIPEAMPLAAE